MWKVLVLLLLVTIFVEPGICQYDDDDDDGEITDYDDNSSREGLNYESAEDGKTNDCNDDESNCESIQDYESDEGSRENVNTKQCDDFDNDCGSNQDYDSDEESGEDESKNKCDDFDDDCGSNQDDFRRINNDNESSCQDCEYNITDSNTDVCDDCDEEIVKEIHVSASIDDCDSECHDCNTTDKSTCAETKSTIEVETTKKYETTEMPTTTEKPGCEEEFEHYLSVLKTYGIKYLSAALIEYPQKTILISPWKINLILGTIYRFSNGNSKEELYEILQIKDKDKLHCVLLKTKDYVESLRGEYFYTGTVVAINNNNYKFTEKAVEEIELIDGRHYELNFGNNIETVDTLNKDLNTLTKGLVQDAIKSYDLVNNSTQLLVADSLYSKIVLLSASTETVKNDYICAPFKVQSVEFNVIEAYTYFTRSEEFTATITSFDSPDAYRTTIIQSYVSFGAKDVMKKIIENPVVFRKQTENMKKDYVKLFVPKTGDINTSFDWISIIKQFAPSLSDDMEVENFVYENKSLVVSNYYQRAKLQNAIYLEEVKTSQNASQVTAQVIELKYPFIFIIEYKGITLYTGLYVGCENSS